MNENNSIEKVCFIISPIGEEGTDIRRRADEVLRAPTKITSSPPLTHGPRPIMVMPNHCCNVQGVSGTNDYMLEVILVGPLKYIIQPALEKCGYTPIRADQMSSPGMVTHQILEQILTAPIAVADLTGRNPNVLYELAARHSANKPVIQMIDANEPIPFDVADNRTIKFSHTSLSSSNQAIDALILQIKSIEDGNLILSNPISVAKALLHIKDGQTFAPQSGGEIWQTLQDLRTMVSELHRRNNLLSLRSATEPSVMP